MRQGEIWWAETEDKKRPILIVTRSEAIPVLSGIIVVPVSRTVRHIPTEILLSQTEGLPVECAASFDNIRCIRKSALTQRIGDLGIRYTEICHALKALTNC